MPPELAVGGQLDAVPHPGTRRQVPGQRSKRAGATSPALRQDLVSLLLLGEALVLGFVFRCALGLFGDLLHLLLDVLGFLLGILY